jgi:hypothetical protein
LLFISNLEEEGKKWRKERTPKHTGKARQHSTPSEICGELSPLYDYLTGILDGNQNDGVKPTSLPNSVSNS